MNRALLALILLIFLAVIGEGISKRTKMAVAPPVFDPISYYCKAELVWSALEKGDLHGLLNGPMAIRPPRGESAQMARGYLCLGELDPMAERLS